MRWSIRYQILVPLFLLLLGLVGVCAWTAQNSARLARKRIVNQVSGVIRTLSEAQFPLNQHVLEQMEGLSGAEYLLIEPDGKRVSTFVGDVADLPSPVAPAQALAEPTLGSRIQVAQQPYVCRVDAR